ncbi:MAG TPA: YafY family protein [Candidatus Obscuribacterales bacterium]
MSTKLHRLLAMFEEIRRNRYPTPESFSAQFEVGLRTVYEDIRTLKERLGLEIEFDRFHNGYVCKDPNQRLPMFELSEGELLALALGQEMLTEYTGSSFEATLRAALDKINDRLPERIQVDLEELRQIVRFKANAVIPVARKLFMELKDACEKRLQVHLEYYSASTGETTPRTVEPYRLLDNRGTWYLVAYCHLRHDMRLFALHRIRDYEVRETEYVARDAAEVDKWIDSAFQIEHRGAEQTVKIMFDIAAARYIRERTWHSSQAIEEHDDGSCTITFVTQSLDEILRWVLQYGGQAEILEPPELRDMMLNAISEMSERYRTARVDRKKVRAR